MAATPQLERAPQIEFWFEFGRNYSYLSVMRIEDLASKYGVRVSWQPFLLGPIFQSFGWNNSPFVLQKEKGEYVWKDMTRLLLALPISASRGRCRRNFRV